MNWSRTFFENRLSISMWLLLLRRKRILGIVLLGIVRLFKIAHELVHDIYRHREDDCAVVLC